MFDEIKLLKQSVFYENCKRNRSRNAKICQDCPFREYIEKWEELYERASKIVKTFPSYLIEDLNIEKVLEEICDLHFAEVASDIDDEELSKRLKGILAVEQLSHLLDDIDEETKKMIFEAFDSSSDNLERTNYESEGKMSPDLKQDIEFLEKGYVLSEVDFKDIVEDIGEEFNLDPFNMDDAEEIAIEIEDILIKTPGFDLAVIFTSEGFCVYREWRDFFKLIEEIYES